MLVNEQVYTHLNQAKVRAIVDEYWAKAEEHGTQRVPERAR
jgi:hypothetical protein